jgi:MFS family permease
VTKEAKTMSEAKLPPLSGKLNFQLSLMMFLQYAIWGAWLPLLWSYLDSNLGFTGTEIGHMFAVGAVGAILAPLVGGQIADRYLSTEKFLGLAHVIGAVLVWQLPNLTGYWSFLAFSLLYSIVYSPTLSLTNSISFHHIPDRDRDFGKVRLWGTVGWIVVGITIGHWLLNTWTPDPKEPAQGVTIEQLIAEPEAASARAIQADPKRFDGLLNPALIEGSRLETIERLLEQKKLEKPLVEGEGGSKSLDKSAALASLNMSPAELDAAYAEDLPATIQGAVQKRGMADAFRLSAILGLLLGLWSFLFLPKTPPSKQVRESAVGRAFKEIRLQPLLMLFLLAVPVSCIHQFYFVHTAPFLGSYQLKTASVINSLFGVGGGGLMTVGQMMEIAVLGFIPFFAKKTSRKTLLGIGLLAYALRMALFAYVDVIPLPVIVTLVLGVALHGFCFGCFIFVAFMVVDEETKPDVRASAQSLFNLVIVGIGIIVGSMIAGSVAGWATSASGAIDYTRLFSVPMWAALGCLVLLLLFYPKHSPRRGMITAEES